jgi:hypothetical protein
MLSICEERGSQIRDAPSEVIQQVVAIWVLMLALGLLVSTAGHSPRTGDPGFDQLQGAPLETADAQATAATAPRCEIAGKNEITIVCEYSAISSHAAIPSGEPKIVLNRAFLSFKTNTESQMRVELTFTNAEATQVSSARSVYLAIDDDSGQNYVRRVLPHIDLRKLTQDQPSAFSERLLTAAFQPGHYIIKLWIPDPSEMFNPVHNWLLSSNGVPDRATGLNIVAKFTVAR